MKSEYLAWVENNREYLMACYKAFIGLSGHKWSFATYCKQQFMDSDMYRGF